MEYTNEQIIDGLRRCACSDMEYCKGCAFNHSLSCASDLLNIAADVIQNWFEIEPKQDKRKGDGCYCPKCGSFVGIKSEEVTEINNYCSECGQKIKQVTE